jgi:hypothetical protein
MAAFLSSTGYTHAYIDDGTVNYKNIDHLKGKIHHFDGRFIFYINENRLVAHNIVSHKDDLYFDATYISGSFGSSIIVVCIQEKIYYIELSVLKNSTYKLKFLCDKQDNFVCRNKNSCLVFNGEHLYHLYMIGSSLKLHQYEIKNLTFHGNKIFAGRNIIYSDKDKIKFLQSDDEIVAERDVKWVKLNQYIYLSIPSAESIESNGKNVLVHDKSVIVTEYCNIIPVPNDAELLYYHQKKAVKSARNI